MSDQHIVGEFAETHKSAEDKVARATPTRRQKARALFEQQLEQWCLLVRESAREAYEFYEADAGSDLERVFMAALMFIQPNSMASHYGGPFDVPNLLEVAPQYPVGRYKIDFAVLIGPPGAPDQNKIRVGIECDGQYFHDRTEKQAARDKARDRFLTLNGWHVVRFVESEIMRNPLGCAAQVSALVDSLVERRLKEIGKRDLDS